MKLWSGALDALAVRAGGVSDVPPPGQRPAEALTAAWRRSRDQPKGGLPCVPGQREAQKMKRALQEAAAPLARLIGHSVAAVVGFCALAGISLIPIEILKVLALLGFAELARPLRVLEETLLFADVCLFAVIFLSGAAVFAAETIAAAKRRIRHVLGATHRDQ